RLIILPAGPSKPEGIHWARMAARLGTPAWQPSTSLGLDFTPPTARLVRISLLNRVRAFLPRSPSGTLTLVEAGGPSLGTAGGTTLRTCIIDTHGGRRSGGEWEDGEDRGCCQPTEQHLRPSHTITSFLVKRDMGQEDCSK